MVKWYFFKGLNSLLKVYAISVPLKIVIHVFIDNDTNVNPSELTETSYIETGQIFEK